VSSKYDPIIETYYELRDRIEGRPKPTRIGRKTITRNRANAAAYLKWCRNAGIDDPALFMRYRFECAKHTGYWCTWTKLRSNKLAVMWKEWREGHALADVHAERLKHEAGSAKKQAVKTLRLLTRSMETYQARYVGREELCAATTEHSGGYHPESSHCPTCPQAVRCAAALYQRHGFDVVALRAGRLHSLPADIVAAAVG